MLPKKMKKFHYMLVLLVAVPVMLILFVQYPNAENERVNAKSVIAPPVIAPPVIAHTPVEQDTVTPLRLRNVEETAVKQPVVMEKKKESDAVQMFSENHYILGLSDFEFDSKKVSDLMIPYGEADGGGSCQQDFGNSLVNRWRERRTSYCSHNPKVTNSKSASSIDCFLVSQTRHAGHGDNLCLLQNVKMDMHVFADQRVTNETVKDYVESNHWHQPYIHFEKGFLSGNCIIENSEWKKNNFPGWNEDVVFRGFQANTDESELQCDTWVEHPVLIVQRDTFANFFHGSEDMVNAFLALAILEWPAGDTQIYLTDLYPRGPFWNLWSQVYSHGPARPAVTAWDLRSQVLAGGDKNICFRKLGMSIYGPAAPITVASWDTPCSNTALVRAYADFVIRGLNLQNFTRYSRQSPSNIVQVTYMARRPSVVWPEKAFCDDFNSFFFCEYWADKGIRPLGRTLRNDAELVYKFKELESQSYKNGAKVVFREVDYNLLSFEGQIKNDINTDLMIGPHGAGLMHNIFMPDRAVLMELFVDGSSGNRHFHNLAHWSGHKYVGRQSGNPIDVHNVFREVVQIIEEINLSRY